MVDQFVLHLAWTVCLWRLFQHHTFLVPYNR